MFQRQYVTAEQLAGFAHYKYSAVDTNPLSVYVMQPLWNRLVKTVPLWIAPNVLTFSGFLIILLNYFILSLYDWHYTASGPGHEHVPAWVWLFAAFTTFCAYALDSVDGKHARRTQSSSPLGELFDHGLDSWAASVFTFSLFSVFGCTGQTGIPAARMYSVSCVILFTFMLSHWEKYNTGVLFLPWAYDASQVTLTVVYLLTAAFGIEAWHRPLLFGYYFVDILIALLVGCSIFLALPQTLHNIFRAYLRKTLKKESLYEGLLPLVSPCLLFVLFSIWVALSPYDILRKQPRLFLWIVGVAFSNVTCRVIICQMTNTRTEAFHWLLLPLAAVVCAAATGFLGKVEEHALSAFAFFVTAAHVHYGICVGRQLGKHFNICIFSLKKRIEG
ncbi:ethanolaminephosphotransferase 1-like [Rhinatrema bivittatum]|uniref:ethanolaminephosphotransferase 1-like n=1 Tax=Rhinatrema bivittatum TaxID=194408 RepID=UPI00112902B7|nr:ethanolaminephosphotransferase 1-like [Rhinatrema bivittatum]